MTSALQLPRHPSPFSNPTPDSASPMSDTVTITVALLVCGTVVTVVIAIVWHCVVRVRSRVSAPSPAPTLYVIAGAPATLPMVMAPQPMNVIAGAPATLPMVMAPQPMNGYANQAYAMPQATEEVYAELEYEVVEVPNHHGILVPDYGYLSNVPTIT